MNLKKKTKKHNTTKKPTTPKYRAQKRVPPFLSHTCCSPASLSHAISSYLHLSSQTQLFWLDISSHPYPRYSSTIQCHTLSLLLPQGDTRLKCSISLGPADSLALCANLTPCPHSQQWSWAARVWQSSPMCRHVLRLPTEPPAFWGSGTATPAPWHQWTDRRYSKQICSYIQA